MTVKIYTGSNSQRRVDLADFNGEIEGFARLIKAVWQAFQHQGEMCAILANLHWPDASLVVVTQRGIGVVELKHYGGLIMESNEGNWCAGSQKISSGEFNSPFEEVHHHAKRISEKVNQYIFDVFGDLDESTPKMIQTAVCFTDLTVDLRAIKATYRPHLEPWEQFEILTDSEFVQWVGKLRFGVNVKKGKQIDPFLLAAETAESFASLILNGEEWKDFYSYMPTGSPYGFLVLEGDTAEDSLVYPLVSETIEIGRDLTRCEVSIPEKYSLVSRVHACIRRHLDGVYLEDLGRHGTLLDGNPLEKNQEYKLSNGQVITLAQPYSGPLSCQLVYLLDYEKTKQT